MIHLMRRDNLVLDPLVVKSDSFLSCSALIEEEILDYELIFTSVPNFEFLLF